MKYSREMESRLSVELEWVATFHQYLEMDCTDCVGIDHNT